MAPDPIHNDRNVQSIDVRVYFGADEDAEIMLDAISDSLGDIDNIVAAFELLNDGFGRLTPTDDPIV